ncbi:exported hypothetical protein [Candidatus Sulfotelmatobacter sp. SbA7]|nr:exported hypothetical protein [Candidatus Sulfotelmatobacter sp. SbA7]
MKKCEFKTLEFKTPGVVSAAMRLSTMAFYSALAIAAWAQPRAPRPVFSRIWHKGNQEVSIRLDGIAPHGPAFIGEDAMRARLRLLNIGKIAVFVEAFDLTSPPDDRALLHDVFAKEQCRKVENSPRPIHLLHSMMAGILLDSSSTP